jgi:hypothetical protein
MSLVIDDVEVDALAKRLAALTGLSEAEAVREALRERLAQVELPMAAVLCPQPLGERLAPLLERVRHAQLADERSDDEILGYGELGRFD